MKVSEFRGRTDEELRVNLRELGEELFNLRFQVVTGQVGNPVRARMIRRSIARIHTVLRERELAES